MSAFYESLRLFLDFSQNTVGTRYTNFLILFRIMAKLGIAKMQDLIGRTDLLKKYDSKGNNLGKSRFLQFDTILKNALDMRPGTNIVGGSIGKKTFSSRFHH